MEYLTTGDIKSIFLEIRTLVDAEKETLTRLDSAMGDGDLGITMSRAFQAASNEATNSEERDVGKLLMHLGMTIAKTSPSTLGTLLATGFMKGGKSIENKENIGTEEMAAFFETFVKALMDRGKSAPGNKTIIDTLYPASMAIRSAAQQQRSLSEVISAGLDSALMGLDASTQMKAMHGRAAYYQDDSIGKQDGGATVGTFIIRGFFQHISNKNKTGA